MHLAFPSTEGQNCVFDELPADYVALFDELAAASSDNTMLIPWEIWQDNFIHEKIGLTSEPEPPANLT